MLRYTITFPDPHTHHAEVELEVPASAAPLRLWMPTWTPGSYLIRDFARNLRDLRAEDAAGRPLPVQRLDKTTFEVAATHGSVRVRYRLFLFERSVRTSYVDADHALVNGASFYLAVEGREGEPHGVEVQVPPGWTVETALRREAEAGSAGHAFIADHYERLCDAPILCGALDACAFEARGVPHRIALVGPTHCDLARACADARRVVEAAADLFGGLPYERYVFLVLTASSGRGGLEHHDSSVLLYPRFGFYDEKGWLDFLTLIAHEHFHVWNIKRMRPRDLTPYDLRREMYTRLLWVAEGVTSYYDELLPLRAGVMSRAAWLKRQGEAISRHWEDPGRRVMDLEEASLTAWTRLYRPDEDTPNSTVSYYTKGALVAMLLDLELRRRTASRRSLDDVMRLLHERFGPGSPGFTAEDFERLAAEVAGDDLGEHFDRWVRSTAELELEEALAAAGLRLLREDRPEGVTVRDLIGVRLKKGVQALAVEAVERGSPAERAGLSPRDEIAAVGGFRVRHDNLVPRLRACAQQGPVDVYVFRDDRLRALSIAPRLDAGTVLRLACDDEAGAAERDLRERWLASAAQP